MALTAWFVGSITTASISTTVDATPVTLTAASRYLRHATSALSILDSLAAAIVAAVGGTCTIVVQRDRLIRVDFNTARTVTWSGTQLRDLLGFAGNLGSAASHTATNVSPLLWSPGYLATPTTIAGVDGYTVPHQAVYKSDDGTQVGCDHYGSETWQELSWTHIMPDRLRVDDSQDGGGTFHEFFEQCALLRRRLYWYPDIDESLASSTAVTWVTGRGPYVLRPEFDGRWYRRNEPYAEVSSPLDLPLHLVEEYA